MTLLQSPTHSRGEIYSHLCAIQSGCPFHLTTSILGRRYRCPIPADRTAAPLRRSWINLKVWKHQHPASSSGGTSARCSLASHDEPYGGNQRNGDYAPRHRVAANRRPGPLSTIAGTASFWRADSEPPNGANLGDDTFPNAAKGPSFKEPLLCCC